MVYNNYITKKRARFQGAEGVVNIPFGTICPVIEGFISYQGKKLCYIDCYNQKQFFYGWADENPEEELERQKLWDKLSKISPNDSVEELEKENNVWRRYGKFEGFFNGSLIWTWNKEVEDYSSSELNRLLKCCENNQAPLF